jgi:hypothetical protein
MYKISKTNMSTSPSHSETSSTSNGFEIKRPTERLDAEAYRQVLEKMGLNGESPTQRVEQLKALSADRIAVLLNKMNKGLQGSKDSLINKDRAMRIGDKETIAPEHRYDVFTKLIEDIKATPEDTNPSRIGDALALGVVLLHPFEDGNGRTARTLGLTFREYFDDPAEYTADFDVLTEPRDAARKRGGFMINGYIPHLQEGESQSDPVAVSEYLHSILYEESENGYVAPYPQDPLKI